MFPLSSQDRLIVTWGGDCAFFKWDWLVFQRTRRNPEPSPLCAEVCLRIANLRFQPAYCGLNSLSGAAVLPFHTNTLCG